MSTSHPPDVIYVMGVFKPTPFFAALPLPCIILNANRRTKKKRGRPGNEAKWCNDLRSIALIKGKFLNL